jgi:hypothetical protein
MADGRVALAPTPRGRFLNRRGTWPWWLAPALVVVVSAGLMHLAERTFRLADSVNLPDGYRLQDWTSNWTMQTLGLEDMLPFGPKALWFDHVYPPLLDGIRYLLMLPETRSGLAPNAINVDFRLYALYAVCFGITNAVIYMWIRDLTRNGWWALGATAIWAISPGYITVMQLLEPSPLAVTFITSMFYLLYRFLKTRRFGYVPAFLAAVLLSSLTRNITQPHVLIILLAATITFWFIASKRSLIPLILSVLLLGAMCVMPIKQQVMFGTWDTSTYSGYHRAGMLWIDPRTVPDAAYPQHIVDSALTFSSRFNTQETLKDNYRLTEAANHFLVSQPVESVKRLAKSLTITFPEMVRPTSMYTENYFVEKIPWRGAYDWIFSSWRYGLLILLSMVLVVWGRGWKSVGSLLRRYGWFLVMYALIAAPVLWSNRYFPGREDEGPIWTDAIRLKIFLEIPFWVFFSYSVWLGINTFRLRRKRTVSTLPIKGGQ